jgi:hypothetical protein
VKAQSNAEPWRLSEEAKRQLEEIGRATVWASDHRLNTIVGPRRPDTSAGLIEAARELAKHEIEASIAEIKVLRKYIADADIVAVGLIEAAKMAEEYASECLKVEAPLSAHALRDFSKVLRARAADRSGEEPAK